MVDENSSDDVISLTDLVGGENTASIAGAPVPSAPSSGLESSDGAEASRRVSGDKQSSKEVAAIDQLLATEDPDFADEMNELAAHPITETNLDMDNSEIQGAISRSKRKKTFKQLLKWLRKEGFKKSFLWFTHGVGKRLSSIKANGGSLLKEGLVGAKARLLQVLSGLRSGLSMAGRGLKKTAIGFSKLSRAAKILIFVIVLLFVALGFVIQITLAGKILPRMDKHFVFSLEPRADAQFSFDPQGPTEWFNNPMLHPEHVLLIERVIVNLRQPGDGSNPMGFFEIYIEASSREAAIELKDREGEMRDLISRTLEQMAYDDLITPAGKNKLKIILRKNLNTVVTKGRVRRVYFKSIVLKP